MSAVTEKDRGPRGGDRIPSADRQWRVLFIGNHGRVIAFKRIKILIWLTVGVVAAALVAVAVLMVVNAGVHGRVRELQKQVEVSQHQVQALRQERDLLTAHVVLAETKMKEMMAGAGRRAADEPLPHVRAENAPDRSTTAPAEPAVVAPPAPVSEPAGEDLTPAAAAGDGIAVEGFHAGVDALRQTIGLRYKLVATRPGRKPVAGHVIVVLKSEDLEPERWLAMPRVDLPKGRPSGRQKGYTFSISHSKAFSHSMPVPERLPAFTQAVVYVFSHEGQLLMAKDYGVDVKPSGG